jgi:hypothetical protein
MSSNYGKQSPVDFAERVRENQRKLKDGLTSQYDFIRLWVRFLRISSCAPPGRKSRRQRALARSRRQRRGAKRDRSGSLG